jgi:hypothetical protein
VKRLAFAIALLPCAAHASTDDAWTALRHAAQRACAAPIAKIAGKAKASTLDGIVTGIGGNGDQYYGVLMSGDDENFPVRFLCLYDKRTKKAQASAIHEP